MEGGGGGGLSISCVCVCGGGGGDPGVPVELHPVIFISFFVVALASGDNTSCIVTPFHLKQYPRRNLCNAVPIEAVKCQPQVCFP